MGEFHKRFSIAHYDRFVEGYENFFYESMMNAEQSFIDNIHDVYFGKFFHYTFRGVEKIVGNAMGVEATDTHIDNLFKLQKERGIEPSLTVNTINFPHEVVFDPSIRSQFVEWIGSFYDRGLRSCTMSSEHIMRSGELQVRCPDMRWKSTVNQLVSDAQQFIDMAYLGYNTILLDRSLNRNIKELRRIKKAQDYLNSMNPKKKLMSSLLVAEACIYNCPFKQEHDSVGEYISTNYFKDVAHITCGAWREYEGFNALPRSGIDLVATNQDTFHEFFDLVDIFKFSGRLTVPMFPMDDAKFFKQAWYLKPEKKFKQSISFVDETVHANDYREIVENNLAPIHNWIPGWIDTRHVKGDWRTTYKGYDGIWSKPEGERLEKLLTSCRSQCWDCHECERTYGVPDIDSALQIVKRG